MGVSIRTQRGIRRSRRTSLQRRRPRWWSRPRLGRGRAGRARATPLDDRARPPPSRWPTSRPNDARAAALPRVAFFRWCQSCGRDFEAGSSRGRTWWIEPRSQRPGRAHDAGATRGCPGGDLHACRRPPPRRTDHRRNGRRDPRTPPRGRCPAHPPRQMTPRSSGRRGEPLHRRCDGSARLFDGVLDADWLDRRRSIAVVRPTGLAIGVIVTILLLAIE